MVKGSGVAWARMNASMNFELEMEFVGMVWSGARDGGSSRLRKGLLMGRRIEDGLWGEYSNEASDGRAHARAVLVESVDAKEETERLVGRTYEEVTICWG